VPRSRNRPHLCSVRDCYRTSASPPERHVDHRAVALATTQGQLRPRAAVEDASHRQVVAPLQGVAEAVRRCRFRRNIRHCRQPRPKARSRCAFRSAILRDLNRIVYAILHKYEPLPHNGADY